MIKSAQLKDEAFIKPNAYKYKGEINHKLKIVFSVLPLEIALLEYKSKTRANCRGKYL